MTRSQVVESQHASHTKESLPKVEGPHAPSSSALKLFLAETLGTFLLVLFGCGSVHAAVVMGAQAGLWQVAIVWGISIMLAIYLVGAISGAHINPAITLAMAVWRRFAWSKVPGYIAAQLLGAFLAAAMLYACFSPFIAAKERSLQIAKGAPASVVTAMCYGEYFPNPGGLADGPLDNAALADHFQSMPHLTAFTVELLGTAILAMVVFGVTDTTNLGAPDPKMIPVFIGLTVSALISVLAPLTQACFNPARDFGPRLFACLAGWGSVAIPGPNGIGFFTVYILAPIIGALLGAGLYQRVLRTGVLTA